MDRYGLVTSPIVPASFTRGYLTTAPVITHQLTQGIRTTFLMKIHPYLFYSKQALRLQLPTTNPGTTHVYERERNCTISSTFAHYLENTTLKDLALKDKKTSFHQMLHSQVRKDTASQTNSSALVALAELRDMPYS